MSLPTVPDLLTDLVAQATDAAGLTGILDTIEPAQATNNADFGDYQSNHAFRLGKASRQNPRAVAERIRAALPAHPAVASTSVAGPGFLNFTLSKEWLAIQVQAVANDPHRGLTRAGEGQAMVIDYSSPNVAKRMHVGHMRSTLIGNALHRMHAKAGWQVVADNHIGDWGTQYGKLMVAWERWRDEAAFEADAIGELERIYVRFGKEATEEMQDQARAFTARLQAGDPELLALWRKFVDVSLAEFQGVYDRLGVQFTVTHGESYYNPMLDGILEATTLAGVGVQSEGAVVVRFEETGDKALDGTVLVIRKKDGAYLYGTTDLATLEYRLATWAPGRILYVTDKRQQLHFRQVFRAWSQLRAAADPDERLPQLEHVWFGTLNLPTGVMSSREGLGVVRLVDFMDEAVTRARAVVDEKSAELSDEERATIAEAVGLSAVRYADLSQNPQSDIMFDFDRMLSFEGNTAPFLLYSYARLKSVQRKGGVELPSVDGLAIGEPVERDLAVQIVRYPEAFAQALASSRPNMLCDYLYELATRVNRFYYQSPILKAEEPVRSARLALAEAALRVLGDGMEALGLQALDRM